MPSAVMRPRPRNGCSSRPATVDANASTRYRLITDALGVFGLMTWVSWSDYHNAAYVADARAMRTGEVQWLDELARPAALRQIYTQIDQCAPHDPYFHCGMAPAGYGGYRENFNSSHAYFDNLYLLLAHRRSHCRGNARARRAHDAQLLLQPPASGCVQCRRSADR
jgi:hypothetical protein